MKRLEHQIKNNEFHVSYSRTLNTDTQFQLTHQAFLSAPLYILLDYTRIESNRNHTTSHWNTLQTYFAIYLAGNRKEHINVWCKLLSHFQSFIKVQQFVNKFYRAIIHITISFSFDRKTFNEPMCNIPFTQKIRKKYDGLWYHMKKDDDDYEKRVIDIFIVEKSIPFQLCYFVFVFF